MELQTNSRQIPKIQEICADKRYSDVLYTYLQSISIRDGAIRSVSKDEVNFSKLAAKFNLSRQTVSKKMKMLTETGLISFNDKKKIYELNLLENYQAALIPYETVKLLTDSLSEHAISTYVYLLNRYYAEQKPYVFTYEQIKKFIGISTATRSNDDTISNILFVLQKIGLIKYSMKAQTQEDTSFKNIKTIYQIEWVVNKVVKNLGE